MGIKRVGTADDREEWLELRRNYITASAITGWIGPSALPKKYAWYFEDNTRESILAEKLEGIDKEFDQCPRISINHGAHDEKCIIEKVGEMLACPEPDNSMFVNDRWPNVSVTVDAFIGFDPITQPEVEYCQDPRQVEATLHGLSRLGKNEKTILEIKKSISVGWARGEVPPYYINQVRTQLAVLELDFGVIAAECIFKYPREPWRLFWDLRPFIIEQDPAWLTTLDCVNEEFAAELNNRG